MVSLSNHEVAGSARVALVFDGLTMRASEALCLEDSRWPGVRNHYHCGDCGADWDDEWSCCCDDDCPECGSRHWSPGESDDLTEIVREENGKFSVLHSPETAEHEPDYRVIAQFTSAALAQRFVVDGELT